LETNFLNIDFYVMRGWIWVVPPRLNKNERQIFYTTYLNIRLAAGLAQASVVLVLHFERKTALA
jgi:hypothetical protein